MISATTFLQVTEFQSLAAAYKARATAINSATATLKEGFFHAPVTSPAEVDAARILIVKGKANYAKDQANDVATAAIEKANAAMAAAQAASAAAAAAAPAPAAP